MPKSEFYLRDLGKIFTICRSNIVNGKNAFAFKFSIRFDLVLAEKWIGNIFLNCVDFIGNFFFSNTCHQYCVCPAAPLLIFFIQNPLEVNYFKWRAIRKYYFILNCTGNVRLMADFCPWDSRGEDMENKVWDRAKPEMGVHTMSDTDIT